MNFSKARDLAGIDWGDGTPATFHEQRSLAERLYKTQGINTKELLGHKSQTQTDRYHDDRGKDWIKIVFKCSQMFYTASGKTEHSAMRKSDSSILFEHAKYMITFEVH